MGKMLAGELPYAVAALLAVPFNEWIMRYAEAVEVVTCLAFGVLFLFKGIQTLAK